MGVQGRGNGWGNKGSGKGKGMTGQGTEGRGGNQGVSEDRLTGLLGARLVWACWFQMPGARDDASPRVRWRRARG